MAIPEEQRVACRICDGESGDIRIKLRKDRPKRLEGIGRGRMRDGEGKRAKNSIQRKRLGKESDKKQRDNEFLQKW